MSVATGIGKLREAAKRLRQDWGEVQESWQDENARRFYEQHIAPLLARVRRMEQVMSQMAATVQKARHDCG
ncbi:MAG: hypothetical protein AB1716_05470 [Planctomycetota bacterium]